MSKAWSVQEAKAQLSEVLRRARQGRPQRVGAREPCVVVSQEAWEAAQSGSLGAWLVQSAPRGPALRLPSRRSSRPVPFGEDEGA